MRLALLAILLLCLFPATAAAASSADLGVSVTDDTDPVSGGTDFSYTITVTNNGPAAASSPSLSNTLPAATTFKSIDAPSGWACTPPPVGSTGTITCSAGSVAAGAETTFIVTVHLPADTPDGSVLHDTATVSTAADDPDSNNNTWTEDTAVENDADLAITKSASTDTVLPGGQITYTIDVTNNGPSDAANAVWTDTLPSDTTFVSETQNDGPIFSCTTPAIGAGGTVGCSIASLPAGSSARFTVTVGVNAAPSSAAITNTATVSSSTADFAEDPNNSASTTTYLLTTGDLSVTKSDSPDPVIPGSELTYTIAVHNSSATPVGDVVLTDDIPAGTSFDSITGGPVECSAPDPGSGGTIECTIPSIAAGATVTYTLKVTVLTSQDNGSTITNTASVSSSTNTDPNHDNDSATATTTVQASADLHVWGFDVPDPVLAGNNLTYTINADNNGPADAHGVTLADALPSGTTFVSLDAPGSFSCTTPAVGTNGTINCSGGTVDLAGVTFTLVVKVDPSLASGTMLSDTATFSSTTPEANPGDESTTVTTTVNTRADVEVAKSGSPDTVAPTQDITYTIDVANNGPSDAANATMLDTMPAGTTFKSLSQSSGPTFTCTTGADVTCSAATLAAGAKAKFTLVVTVDANATGSISNTATVSTTTAQIFTQNDSATAVTQVQPQADLAVTKSDSPDPVTAGTDLTYTLGVKDNGPQDATNVSLSDDLPAGTTFKSISAPAGFSCSTPAVGSGGNVKCTASTLANGTAATFALVVHVAADRADGSTLSNTASASNDVTDPNSANDSATTTTSVATSADVSTSVSDSPDPVNAGGVVTYHMHIHNGGPSDASQPRLTVPIPSGTVLVGAAPTDGSAFHCTSDGTTVTCAADSLASGGSAAIDMAIQTTRSQSGTISANPKASSSTNDPDGSNDTSSESTTIAPAPPAHTPTRVTIGTVRKRRASGALIVPIGCSGRTGQICLLGVRATFKPPHSDLAPIHTGQSIRAGRRALVYLIGPPDERRAIKRIHRLVVHISVTNGTGTGANGDATVR